MLKKHKYSFKELNPTMSALLTQTTATENFLPSLEPFISFIHDLASKINYLAINTAILTEQTHSKDEGFQNAIAKRTN
jgi:hypothetical protein